MFDKTSEMKNKTATPQVLTVFLCFTCNLQQYIVFIINEKTLHVFFQIKKYCLIILCQKYNISTHIYLHFFNEKIPSLLP